MALNKVRRYDGRLGMDNPTSPLHRPDEGWPETEHERAEHYHTLMHIRDVQFRLLEQAAALMARAQMHDLSKLQSPEMKGFAEAPHKLKGLTYGSDEYKAQLKESGLAEAVVHHQQVNRHHPECFANGVNDMTLADITEMLADWCAAVTRHDDGDIWESLEHNTERFNLSDQLVAILKNQLLAWGYQYMDDDNMPRGGKA